uniref:NADH-ubiquinone oxidoreductase chain 1 n=1 Tax=Caiman yacare TaxID=141269 RepID=A0A7L8ZV78_9SAUR|nr:NADH dehydrogenase subunit 1 [Caiman yacare]QYA18212.1 NADH dehydrogenase subunit 1 [Caiman yacare]
MNLMAITPQVLFIISILIAVAFLTALERKIIGHIQLRKGPNTVGLIGLLQPFADGFKLIIKELTLPMIATPTLFMLAPATALTLSLTMWAPIPMPFPLVDLNLGLLFLLAMSSLMVYSLLWSGWSSNSKYALMGAMRAVAQTISYEVTLAIIVLSIVLLSGGFSLQTLITTQEPLPFAPTTWPLMMMWYTSTLAETNRAPFDLTEGESELVSGFNVEYGASPFTLFFLAEYANIMLMNTLTITLFLNPSPLTFIPTLFTAIMMTEALMLTMSFLWVRASYPRFRYDQLMYLLWKSFLPLTLAFCLWHTSLPMSMFGLPPGA